MHPCFSTASHLWQNPKSSHTFPKYPFCGASPSRTTGTHQQASLPSSAPSKSPKPLSALPAKGLCCCFPLQGRSFLFLPKTHRSPSFTPLLTWHSSPSLRTGLTSYTQRPLLPPAPWACFPIPLSAAALRLPPSPHPPSLTHLPISTCLSPLATSLGTQEIHRQGEEKRIIKEYLRGLRIKK